jgi:DNA-directed RNA polymerase
MCQHPRCCVFHQVYEGLSIIGKVPYRINKRVHDVVKQAWEQGGGIADLPARVNHPEPPPLPDDAYYPSPEAKAAALRYCCVVCTVAAPGSPRGDSC